MLSPLVKAFHPLCSVERAKELGLDLERVSTCAPYIRGQQRGCTYWQMCRFNRKEYGAFKGTRPHIIGYYLRDIEGASKLDTVSCFGFIASGLQARQDMGRQMRDKGQAVYEVVKVVAQEGEPIKVRRTVMEGKGVGAVAKNVVQEVPVPTFADPLDMGEHLAYESEIERQYLNEEDGIPTGAEVEIEVEETPKGKRGA